MAWRAVVSPVRIRAHQRALVSALIFALSLAAGWLARRRLNHRPNQIRPLAAGATP